MFPIFSFTQLFKLEHSCNQLLPSLSPSRWLFPPYHYFPLTPPPIKPFQCLSTHFQPVFFSEKYRIQTHVWAPSFCHYWKGSKFWQIEFSPTLMFQCQVIDLIEHPILDQKFSFCVGILSDMCGRERFVKRVSWKNICTVVEKSNVDAKSECILILEIKAAPLEQTNKYLLIFHQPVSKPSNHIQTNLSSLTWQLFVKR